MSLLSKTLLLSALLFSFPILTEAKEWRGIVPLKSTREDVKRILGRSRDANRMRANYDLDEGHIYIAFSNDEDYNSDCVKKLPKDIVLLIVFRPKVDLTLSDLKPNLTKFRKFDPSIPQNLGFEAYVSEEEGLIVTTYKGKVSRINYLATKEDQKLCPEYYETPESFVRMVIS
jgi:hypothetical protein